MTLAQLAFDTMNGNAAGLLSITVIVTGVVAIAVILALCAWWPEHTKVKSKRQKRRYEHELEMEAARAETYRAAERLNESEGDR